jgi:hypothetical protein
MSLALAALAMILPLVWVCLHMAAHVPGGTGLLAGIGGAVAIGALTTLGGLSGRF